MMTPRFSNGYAVKYPLDWSTYRGEASTYSLALGTIRVVMKGKGWWETQVDGKRWGFAKTKALGMRNMQVSHDRYTDKAKEPKFKCVECGGPIDRHHYISQVNHRLREAMEAKLSDGTSAIEYVLNLDPDLRARLGRVLGFQHEHVG